MHLNSKKIYSNIKIVSLLSLLLLVAVGIFILTFYDRRKNSTEVCSIETLDDYIQSVNQYHKSIRREQADHEKWLRKPVENIVYDPYIDSVDSDELGSYDEKLLLTLEETKEDVDYFFQIAHDTYGLYDYFGGESAFNAAKEAVLAECEKTQEISCESLEKILLENLTFVEDGHFLINKKSFAKKVIPFFYREVVFEKTDKGYVTLDGKRVVESIEGFPNLDQLFKPSISDEGRLVYFPVLLSDYNLTFEKEMTQQIICEEELLVHYTDGSSQILNADPFQMYYEAVDSDTYVLEEDQEMQIPILRIRQCVRNGERKLYSYIEEIRDKPIAILDLRSNGGGYLSIPLSIMQRYAGKMVPPNASTINVWSGVVSPEVEDDFVENENLLIILVSKYTASAAESLVDIAYNLENVLVIGENTSGTFLGNSATKYLPNSKIEIRFADAFVQSPPNYGEYFQELRGFYPDLWVPASEAENLAIRLVKRYL